MRILLVTTHFYPEDFKANDMAFDLAARGHKVTVLTPIPDYPRGRYFDGYGIFKRRKETIKRVKIIRTFVTPRRDGSSKWLALNYLTYTLFSILRSLSIGLTSRFDAVIVHETSPVTVGIPAVIVKKMQQLPLYFWVLDLWPESLQAAGNINNGKILRFFRHLTAWIYRNSDHILISSEGFRKSICDMGDFNDKIEFFPNWVDSAFISSTDHKQPLPELPDGFNVVFAGNIGDAQDVPHILDAAEQLRDTNINFVLVGDGRRREYAQEEIQRRGLSNVYLPGRYPLTSMPALFKKADVLFLSLKDSPIFALTVPAKLTAYMSAGKPIVAMINGEGADVIRRAGCGWTVPAEDSAALATTLRDVTKISADNLSAYGKAALEYCSAHYTLQGCMDRLNELLPSPKK